jgi:hypothetical protein
MVEWELWNVDRTRVQKLDTLAKVLGLPTSKDEMELTRKVYYKMTFEELPPENEITSSTAPQTLSYTSSPAPWVA